MFPAGEATASIASGVLRILWHQLGWDGLRFDLMAWREILSLMFLSPGAITRALPGYFSYFRPGFHPWQHDDRELLGVWMRAYPAVAGAPVSSFLGDA